MYEGLTASSSLKDFQLDFHKKGINGCEMPCPCIPKEYSQVLPVVDFVNASGSLPYGHPSQDASYPHFDGFTLYLVEEFDEPLDLLTDPIWTYSDGGLGEGSVRFVKEGIKFENGKMILEMGSLGHKQGDTCSHAEVGPVSKKTYTSGEMRTRYNLFRYGIYEARFKVPDVKPGNLWVNGNFISTVFAFRDGKFRRWREIDVEVLGNGPNYVSTNVINGDDTPSFNMHIQHDQLVRPWGLNARAEFHTYGFAWLPNKITWYVDGKEVRSYYHGRVPIPDLSTKIIMNLWIFDGGQFGGKEIWNNHYPLRAEYEWIRYYKWNEDKYPCRNMDASCLSEDDLWMAGNNPCDGIPNQGDLLGACTCNAPCPFV